MRRDIPKHIVERYGSARKFRTEKRRQANEARSALGNLRFGCAYTPAMTDIDEAIKALDAITSKLSQKNWGK